MMARKRNLEGTTSSLSTFSALNIETIKSLSSNMGALSEDINFDTFDMLKDLKNARNKLHNKSLEIEVIDIVDDDKEENINVRRIEWLQDDLSETESTILSHSKNRGKLSK